MYTLFQNKNKTIYTQTDKNFFPQQTDKNVPVHTIHNTY